MRLPVIHRTMTYFGKRTVVACDARCDKAWGINARPRIDFDPEEPDDHAFLADHELPEAPDDPGTYEGDEAKPAAYDDGDDHRLNRWCIRECERSALAPTLDDINLPDLDRRSYNMPNRHPDPS